jgi:hypothetical protein
MNFKKLLPKIPESSSLIHSVLSFPDTGKGKVLVLHGSESEVGRQFYSLEQSETMYVLV